MFAPARASCGSLHPYLAGTLAVYRHSAGFGMRMDGIGYSGMKVQPYYDSLLVKYTASGANWEEVVRRMKRALQEARLLHIYICVCVYTRAMQLPFS